MSRAAPRVAVLISGEGSNLQALLDAARAGTLGAEIAVVVSNRAAARGLVRACEAHVPARHLGGKDLSREAYDEALGALLAEYSPDLIVLAGFMRILSAAFVARFAGLLLDVMLGDPTLFTRTDEVDSAWRFITTILEAWERPSAPPPVPYAAGTWGPAAADALVARDNKHWRRL